MSETVRDDAMVRLRFDEFRDAETPRLTLAGVGTLRTKARRRRRAGVVLAAAALAAVSVVPVVVLRSGSTASDRQGQGAGQAPPVAAKCPAAAAPSGLDLAAVATDIVLGPANAGPRKTWRPGEMTVRICNLSGVPAPGGTFTLRWLATVPSADWVGEGPWKDCEYDRPNGTPVVDGVAYYVVHCRYPRLAAGTSKEFRLNFHTFDDKDAGIDRPAVHYAEVNADGDANPGNNRATFDIEIR